MDMLKDQLRDPIMTILLIAGVITILVNLANGKDWLEGASIIAAVVMIILFTSCNDYLKGKQFQKLNAAVKEQDIAVVRGARGFTKSVNVWRELVVGDVILLEPGCRIPADCIVIESSELTVDENYYNNDEVLTKSKMPCTKENWEENPDCFLLSQSLVISGVGKAVVCNIGQYSRRTEIE